MFQSMCAGAGLPVTKGQHMIVCVRGRESVKPGGTAGEYILSQQIHWDGIFLFHPEIAKNGGK